MHGHEVLSPYKREPSFLGDSFYTVTSVTSGSVANDSLFCGKKRLQATSLMFDFDEVNFAVTVTKYISLFGSHLNGIGMA
jgi:hypothetical protein